MRDQRSGTMFGRPQLIGLLVAGLLGLAATAAAGAGVEVALLPDVVEVQPGEVFDLEVTVPVAGDSLNGYETTIEFDPTLLDFIELSPRSLQEGELMTSACSQRWHLFNETNGVITISHVLLCSGVKVAGPGVLYRLRFQARDTVATTDVVFAALEVYDAGTYVTPVTSENALVRIGNVTAVPGEGPGLGLGPPQPNPFRSATTLSFTARGDGRAVMDVFTVTGRRVRRLWEGGVRDGVSYRARWDGRDEAGRRMGAGVYLVRVAGPAGCATGRVVLVP